MSLNPKKSEPRDPTHQDHRAIEEITLHADSLRTSIMRHIRDAGARREALSALKYAVDAAHKGVLA